MLYPKFLEEKSKIGITAPSSGVGDYLESFEKSLNTLKNMVMKLLKPKALEIKE